MINGLDLFSGVGGISLGLSPWVRTTAYCEADRYCQATLLSRMESEEIDRAPIWDDVRTLKAENLPRKIDIIFGGFPCQDISVAGNGAGLEGERSGLFFEVVRLIGEFRPKFIFLENVPDITLRGLERVLLELTALGYDCRWTIVSAAQLGAVHLRERWFLLGHSNSLNGELQESTSADSNSSSLWKKQKQFGRGLNKVQSARISDERFVAWPSEGFSKPFVVRAGDGIPSRMDRIKTMGNAVVPMQANFAFRLLMGLEIKHAAHELQGG